MNKNKKNINTIIMFVLIFMVILLPIIIYVTVNNLGGSGSFGKDNILLYYASIGGACFTGYITAVGLYFTLQKNSESLAEQRQIDAETRQLEDTKFKAEQEIQKSRFDKQYNIQIINDKLNVYKELFNLRTEIATVISSLKQYAQFGHSISKYRYDEFFKIAGTFQFLGSQVSNEELYSKYEEIVNNCYELKDKIDTTTVTKEQVDLVNKINELLIDFSDSLIIESKNLSKQKYVN